MRIITLNANGIRAAHKKNLPIWLAKQKADFVCLQEVRAKNEQLGAEDFWPAGFRCHYLESNKAGYSGVAIYSRYEPDEVVEASGYMPFDVEGRYLEFRVGDLSVISLYLPSGTSGDERQTFKYGCMEYLLEHMRAMVKSDRHYVICGDWNIAHKQIDIRNWRSNQKNSGFLPEERAWLDRLYDEVGMVDVFRQLDADADRYTWWSNRGQAWANNVGWRLDLQVATPTLASMAKRTAIYVDERFSDHAPLTIDYDYNVGRRRIASSRRLNHTKSGSLTKES
ncbi:MAG: exodeoxyribonuclease III [Gammaproteobacteria bacterium]